MEFTEVKYIVSHLMGAPQVLTVGSSGKTSYRSHTNGQLLDRPEIGLYETTLDSSRVAVIEKLLSKWPLSEIPDHKATMPQGGLTRLLRITTPSEEMVKEVGPADPVDPRLQEILDFFDDVVQEVMKFPRQVLHVSITIPSIGQEDEISVELQLSNESKEPLYLRRPSDLVSQTDGWLRIEVWPAVPEPGSMWSEQKVYIDPEQVDAILEDNEKSGFCTIAPWTNRKFILRGRLPGKHGRHVARVSYCNFTERIDEKFLIVGHVYTTPVEFEVP